MNAEKRRHFYVNSQKEDIPWEILSGRKGGFNENAEGATAQLILCFGGQRKRRYSETLVQAAREGE